MSLADLDRVMRESLERATPLTRSLFERTGASAAEVQRWVNDSGNVTVATVSPGAIPHAAPVLGCCVDGVLYFTVSPRSVLARNLEGRPRVAFTVVDGRHTVVGQGRAVRVGPVAEQEQLLPSIGVEHAIAGLIRDGWGGELYAIEPSRLFAD